MLHAADEEGQLQIFVGELQTVETGVAHTCRVECIEGGVALCQQTVVQLGSRREVAVHEPRISQGTVHEDVRGVPQTVFHAADDAVLRLIVFRIGEREPCHHLSVHRIMRDQLSRPVDIGVGIALFLITQAELSEGVVGETVLRDVLQQFGGLAIVATLIVAVGQLRPRLQGIAHLEGLPVIPQRLEGVVLLHAAVAQLNIQLNRVWYFCF